jgi:hypothetical protein
MRVRDDGQQYRPTLGQTMSAGCSFESGFGGDGALDCHLRNFPELNAPYKSLYLDGMTDTVDPPNCPNCREPMRLGHVIPRLAGHPEIQSFQCNSCGEAIALVEGEARAAGSLD